MKMPLFRSNSTPTRPSRPRLPGSFRGTERDADQNQMGERHARAEEETLVRIEDEEEGPAQHAVGDEPEQQPLDQPGRLLLLQRSMAIADPVPIPPPESDSSTAQGVVR